MREWPLGDTGGADSNQEWEARLQATARTLDYPATPDIAGAVRQRLELESARPRAPYRRLAWAAVAVLLVLSGLMAVPQVRAAVLRALRLGAVEILLEEPTPTVTKPYPTPTATVPSTVTAAVPTAPTPGPSPTPLSSVLELAGETTLAEAQARTNFRIRLPTYPPNLGPPDRVFLQDLAGPVVVLAWLDPDQLDRVRLSLHQLAPGTFAQKVQPQVIEETSVNGGPALWAEGPHLLQFRRDDQLIYEPRRLVKGHVLIWAEGEITYRLETDLPLEEAVRIAESLR